MFTANHQEDSLFQCFCNNDSIVLKAIYQEAFPLVKKMVCKNSGNKHDAKDIFHEAIIATYRYCEKPGFVLNTSLKTLLYSIARNHWLKHLKKNRQNPVTFFDFWEFVDVDAALKMTNEDEAGKKAEQIRIIAKYLGKLEYKAGQIIYLFYFEKKSMEEIAEILGFANARSVTTQKSKHIKTLRELMEADGIDSSQLFY